MKTLKRQYQPPLIELVKLDNEISLVLISPPIGPGEEGMSQQSPNYFNNATTHILKV